MTKDEALDLALEALESERPYLGPMPSKTVKAITAIKQARSAPVQEPVAIPEYVRKAATNLHENEFREQIFIRAIVGWINGSPPAQPAPVQPVAFEVGLVEWVGNKLMATPKVTTTPPASWVEMVTANLVREGVNKHRARELAEHFYGLAQRPFVGLTDEEMREFDVDPVEAKLMIAKLKEKNT